MPRGATWWAEYAWLGGERNEAGVVLEEKDGRFSKVTTGVAAPPAGATRLQGLTVPGMANGHSHVFHRALRGRTHHTRGSFWSWRELMYSVSERLDPESFRRLAAAVFAEMLTAGYTTVGEFHYLHHSPGGRPYANPNEMGLALIDAADEAGIRITLLDACYLAGGFGRDLEAPQLRFADAGPEAWAERVDALSGTPTALIGAAVHSVRAVPPPAAGLVAATARRHGWPLHAHVSEQRLEVEDSLAHLNSTPLCLLDSAGALDARFTAVHGTHLTQSEIQRLADAGGSLCACPTTEADLGDGIGPFEALRAAGVRICLGSDSHAAIDALAEARALEGAARLAGERRAVFAPGELLEAATSRGMASLGWDRAGALAAGMLADFVTLSLQTPRTAGCDPGLAATAVYAASAADVTDVVVGGRVKVRDGRHLTIPDLAKEIEAAVGQVLL